MKSRIDKFSGFWGIIIICFTSLVFLPTPASSEEPYKFEWMWPSLSHQPWNFCFPSGVALDRNGNIYVVDTGNNRIQKFSPDGALVTSWGRRGLGDGEFEQPNGGIAIDAIGYVYVIDYWNYRIQKFTSDGQFITKWGSQGSRDGEFNHPTGIAVDESGDVYVADSYNHRIQKFTSEGTFIAKWGKEGTGDGEFYGSFGEPYGLNVGIAIDESGDVYVADVANNRIQKFTSDGQFITKWGTYGSRDGEFDCPQGLTIDASGNIYVADSENCRIQKFSPEGLFITTWWREVGMPTGIASDVSGYLFVADNGNDRINKFSSDGRLITRWGTDSSKDGEFNQPKGIAIDGNGYLYVADATNFRIQKFSADGAFIAKWGWGGNEDGRFNVPQGLAIDGSSNVYVADSCNHRIQKFTSDGRFITKWGTYGAGDGEFNLPNGLSIDSMGYIYVADDYNHRIQKFTSDGEFVTKWGKEGSGDGEFKGPFGGTKGIAIDSKDNVYVADSGNFRIQKFNSDGVFITKWGSDGREEWQFCSVMGIAVDSSDRVYVVDHCNNCIKKFTSDGQFITKFGEHGFDKGQLSWPECLCVSPTGKIYVSDTHNNRIQVFSQEGGSGNIKTAKAIILAGGGPFIGNNIWDATEMCANYAYRALTYQGFTKDNIYYLSSDTDLDLDGNGILDDVDGDATNSNLNYAITTWARDTEDLFIYMVDHGGDGTFRIGELELLKAEDLDTWLDTLQNTIPGTVTLVYDACRSGSFIPILDPPPGKERIIATSVSKDEEAIFGSHGTISFSFLFWARMFNGDSFYDSFFHAMNSIGVTYPQNPMLEGNGNGIGNEKEDKDIVRVLKIGNETKSAGDIPVIGSVSPARTLNVEISALIYAENVIDADGISRVWAVITPPDYSPGSPDNPVTDLPILDLTSAGNNRYEGTYNNFTSAGTYTIAIFASDNKGVLSMPKATTVTVPQGSEPDNYEEDDTFGQANVIDLNGDPQSHCFHDTNDKDWVKFYGIAEEIYEIEASNPGAYCDVVIELYDTNGTTLIKGPWNWRVEGEDELMNWRCSQDGIYYVMTRQYDPSVFGDNTEYDLKVFRPIGPFPGFITGAITDAYSGGSIGGAIITTDNNASALSLNDGAYLMVHPAGSFSLTARKPGYTPASYPGVEVNEGGTTTRYFTLAPLSNGNDSDGDVAPLGNRDGTVNVGDALVALRFALLLETPTQEDIEHGDVAPLDAQGQPNPDGVINVGDALVILRKALGIIGF